MSEDPKDLPRIRPYTLSLTRDPAEATRFPNWWEAASVLVSMAEKPNNAGAMLAMTTDIRIGVTHGPGQVPEGILIRLSTTHGIGYYVVEAE